MSKRNYYAVKTEKENKVFTDWNECLAWKKGKKKVSYKAFATEEMANTWLDGGTPLFQPLDTTEGFVTIYTDGSFNKNTGFYGWGFTAYDGHSRLHTDCGQGTDRLLAQQKNVAGEMVAAMQAVKWARSQGYGEIELRYDYAGISSWVDGTWHMPTEEENIYARQYAQWMQKMASSMYIVFTQIPGHSGDAYNEEADALARQGCGL